MKIGSRSECRCVRERPLTARSTVHAVVQAERDPGRVMSDMKARASRGLTRAEIDDATRRRWTRRGSTLHVFNEAAVADKIDYTLNRQGARCFRTTTAAEPGT